MSSTDSGLTVASSWISLACFSSTVAFSPSLMRYSDRLFCVSESTEDTATPTDNLIRSVSTISSSSGVNRLIAMYLCTDLRLSPFSFAITAVGFVAPSSFKQSCFILYANARSLAVSLCLCSRFVSTIINFRCVAVSSFLTTASIVSMLFF